MSEYQYYEFQAVDRSLTSEEMRVLHMYSTRTTITPTRFTAEGGCPDRDETARRLRCGGGSD